MHPSPSATDLEQQLYNLVRSPERCVHSIRHGADHCKLTIDHSRIRLAPVIDALGGLFLTLDEEGLCATFTFCNLAFQTWFMPARLVGYFKKITPLSQLGGGMNVRFQKGMSKPKRLQRFTGFCSSCQLRFCANRRMGKGIRYCTPLQRRCALNDCLVVRLNKHHH